MKSFSLEEYLKNPSRKVVTRDGRKVTRILCTDANGPYPIIALVENYNHYEYPYSLTKEGKDSPGITHSNDLFFITEKHEGWLPIYKTISGDIIPGTNIDKSEKDAIDRSAPYQFATLIKVIKIEWEE